MMPAPVAAPSATTADGVRGAIRNYYAGKVARYGPIPLGVDWSCAPTQELRFVQLLKLIPRDASSFSVNDIGCGYGALAGFMHRRLRGARIDYLGVDLAPEMIEHARRRNRRRTVRFAVADAPVRVADYCVASGIFNVKLRLALGPWQDFIAQTLATMAATSRRGFAVNFLAPADDSPRELYRVAPQAWIQFCRGELGLEPSLVTGYGLREFTLLVPTGSG